MCPSHRQCEREENRRDEADFGLRANINRKAGKEGRTEEKEAAAMEGD